MKNKLPSLKLTGICGILAPVIGLSCIGIAILLSPWFSWTDNYLSDLGGFPGDRPIWAANGLASIIFNSGLVMAGILGLVFAMGIKKNGIFNSFLGNIRSIFFLLCACALVGIGVFPETTGDPHIVFTIAFFILVEISLLLMGITQLRSEQKRMGCFTIVLFIFGLASIPLFMTPKPTGDNAVAEIIPIISISIFLMVLGFKIFNMDPKHEIEDDLRNK
jgi:hypothetical membrane protein